MSKFDARRLIYVLTNKIINYFTMTSAVDGHIHAHVGGILSMVQRSYAVIGNINKNMKMASKTDRGEKREEKNNIYEPCTRVCIHLTGSKVDSDRKLLSEIIVFNPYDVIRFLNINITF